MKNFKPELFNPNDLCLHMMRTVEANRDKVNPETGLPDKIIFCNEGGSRCFDKDTLIVTSDGLKRISDVKAGIDKVLSYDLNNRKKEFKDVSDVIHNKNILKKGYIIRLKNGATIKCTQDHEFFHEGGFVEIKKVVSLHNKKYK